MNEKKSILPCPLCGSSKVDCMGYGFLPSDGGYRLIYGVCCLSCGCNIKECSNEAVAIKKWNKRVNYGQIAMF